MKKTLILLFILFCFNTVHAQFAQNHAIYHSAEVSAGNYLGVDINANYVLRESYSFKIGYSGFIRRPVAAPENYSSGIIGLLTLGLANPYDQLQNIQLMAGKVYKFNKKGTIRANLSLGVAFTIINEPTNWEPVETSSFLAQNYTYDYQSYNTLSLIINPKLEFPFTRYYGLSLSPLLQINKDRMYFGIGIGQMIGLLRGRYEQEESSD
ncbi:hypothetical protein FHG64_05630 [Antarcticibacterium flavum]|uniref:Outer membrane protein beta-barrel domain-containing protein n=1 Tax=Antarcticibacterium flavum TaxID=2058175 RepID=A0A5B7X009_9FLAO|nr:MULTISPECIES: hypothetical protein [Antarcticibacterium]MCM4159926.1 hypothetical protein [Antarcticibacterium sp. W02-3]QCY68924.1 hypothetical protein FHG64_05630 [Antarcticibacterium flavum]